MNVVFTGQGSLAQAFRQIEPSVEIRSFRHLSAQEMRAVVERADVIVHNAACVDQALGVTRMLEANFALTQRIVDLMRVVKRPPRFVNIASMSFLKTNDDYADPLEMSPYALSKFMAEVYVLRVLENATSVRFSTLYYKDPLKDGLSKIVEQAVRGRRIRAYNQGQQKRDVIPLKIAARYLKKVIESDSAETRVNICSGTETRMSDLIVMISEKTGAHIEKVDVEEGPFVLSRFSTRDIDKLGRLDFSLEEHVIAHIQDLSRP